MAWIYNLALKRYQNQATGRILSVKDMEGLRDRFIEAQQDKAREMASKLAARTMTMQQYERQFRDAIKAAYVDSYALGIGGRKNMTFTDFGRLGAMIKAQYQYAHLLAAQIANGQLSEAMIAHRSASFITMAGHAYHMGRAATFSISLPVYPRDGSQDCLYNCRCEWHISEDGDTVTAYWVRFSGRSCTACESNANLYSESNPYTIRRAA